jgi:hypothetical protein
VALAVVVLALAVVMANGPLLISQATAGVGVLHRQYLAFYSCYASGGWVPVTKAAAVGVAVTEVANCCDG